MNNEMVKQGPTTERESISDLLGQLARNSAAVVRDEIQLVVQQIREKATAALTGAVLIVTGAAIGFIACFCLCAALIIGLTSYMAPALAALVTGAALASGGVIIAIIGYRKFKKQAP